MLRPTLCKTYQLSGTVLNFAKFSPKFRNYDRNQLYPTFTSTTFNKHAIKPEMMDFFSVAIKSEPHNCLYIKDKHENLLYNLDKQLLICSWKVCNENWHIQV